MASLVPCLLYLPEKKKASVMHQIGGWEDPRADVDV